MTSGSVDSLEDLASRVDEEFASHRQSDEFKTISLVIDASSSDRPTLIVMSTGSKPARWLTVLRNSLLNTVHILSANTIQRPISGYWQQSSED